MTEKCDVCNSEDSMTYTCSYCGNVHCSDHRLPENHNCNPVEKRDGEKETTDKRLISSLKGISIEDNVSSPTKYILGIFGIIFILQHIVLVTLGEEWHNYIFVLDDPLHVWSFVTSIFAHDPYVIFHLLFNGIVLFFVGSYLERIISTRKYFTWFISAGIVSGFAQLIIQLLFHQSAGVIGSSGAVFAFLAILAIYEQNREFLLFFVIPIKLKSLLYILLLVSSVASVLGIVSGNSFLGIAHVSHLTGLITGLVLVWYYSDKKHKQNIIR